MPTGINIPLGTRFGRLTVLRQAPSQPYIGRRWECVCDCGTIKIFHSRYLRGGNSRSCGCLQRIHGLSKTSEYHIWTLMRRRCRDPRVLHYRNYGGRGIKVCKEWDESFEAFLRDMGPRPSPQHTIERINVNGNYEPSNCKWDTWCNQRRNKTTSKWLTFKGERRLLVDWADIVGLPITNIRDRINKGWDVDRALTTPIVKSRRRSTKGLYLRTDAN